MNTLLVCELCQSAGNSRDVLLDLTLDDDPEPTRILM